MWDSPRPPISTFREHSGEPFTSRWTHGFQPSSRGQPPFPSRGSARGPSPRFANQGGVPFNTTDMGVRQDGVWEQDRIPPEEQLNRRPTNYMTGAFREGEMRDLRFREHGISETDKRARLAPDMDYRDREASVVDERRKGMPDVDHRLGEGPTITYRERLLTSEILKNRDTLEYRKRIAAELDLRERSAIDLEHRGRLSTPLNYRNRGVDELEYQRRLDALFEPRSRGELFARERGATELLFREREAALLSLREREATILTMRERESLEIALKERARMAVKDRETPGHFRESVDMDLRVGESKAQSFVESSTPMHFLERERYSESENMPMKYRDAKGHTAGFQEKEATDTEYMEVENLGVEYKKHSQLKGGNTIAIRDPESTQTVYNQDESHKDTDYRDAEGADSAYHEKERSDLDYRDVDKTCLEYGDMQAVDPYYREKEGVDSDYREKDKADSDYREKERTDSDYRAEKNTESLVTEINDSGSNQKSGKKMPTQLIPLLEYGKLPRLSKEPMSVFEDFREKSNAEMRIPFLSYEETDILSSVAIENTSFHFDNNKTATTEEQGKSNKPNFPGNLDVDFRDGVNPVEVKQGGKEMANKVVANYSTGKSQNEVCTGDQDLRKKDPVSGDCDLRTGGYTQHKDVDLRGGNTEAPVDILTQNPLLFNFIQAATKELKQKAKATAKPETGEQEAVRSHAKASADSSRISRPSPSGAPVKLLMSGSHGPGIEFLGRQDTDYRNMDFNDVDLRIGYSQEKHPIDKKSRVELQPGSKDKDYRKASLPDGATKVIWLDGLPTGISRDEILRTLSVVQKIPEHGVNLIGYIPGYSFGSVCVEFSLVEEAVGFMEANKGTVYFKGKKIALKYIPNSNRWTCQQCIAVNVLSKERCWQCSALRAGTDHLPLRDIATRTSPSLASQRGKKRKAKKSPSSRSPEKWKEKNPASEKSPHSKASKEAKPAPPESATVIIKGFHVKMTAENVAKALEPYAQLSPKNIRIMKSRRGGRRSFGFIDLKSHKEAARLTVLIHGLKPSLAIEGKPVTMELAVGQRNELGKYKKGYKTSLGKSQKGRAQLLSYPYSGSKDNDDDGSSYVFDSKTGLYIDPMTEMYYNAKKKEAPSTSRKNNFPSRVTTNDKQVKETQPRRGFTEGEEKEPAEDAFKKPLPPLLSKKDEPPPEPKVNPLIGLIGEYGDDSEEEEEQEQQPLPPKRKKSPPPPPPPIVSAPKPSPLPAPSVSSTKDDDKFMDWKKTACLLCRRKFSSKETLIRHQKLSELHKKNLAIHEKVKKSQKQLAYLQQKEKEENQSIQRRLQEARKELEMLERDEEGSHQ